MQRSKESIGWGKAKEIRSQPDFYQNVSLDGRKLLRIFSTDDMTKVKQATKQVMAAVSFLPVS